MRKYIYLVLFFGLAQITWAQKDTNKQLYISQWEDPNIADTIKSNALQKLSKMYFFEDVDSALWYASKMLTLKNNDLFQAKAHLAVGSALSIKGLYDSSNTHMLKAHDLYIDLDNLDGKEQAIGNMGRNYYYKGDLEKAIEYWRQGLEMQQEMKDTIAQSHTLSNIGAVFMRLEEYEDALIYTNKALEIQKSLKDTIGSIYSEANIGVIYMETAQYEKALKHLLKIKSIPRERFNSFFYANNISNLANVYQKMGENAKAISHYEQSISDLEKIGDLQQVSYAYNSLAFLYFQENKYVKAEKLYLKSLKISDQTNSIIERRDASKGLYEIYKVLKKPGKALKMFELNVNMIDSLKSEDNIKSVLKQKYLMESFADSLNNAKMHEVKDAENKKKVALEKAKQKQQFIVLVIVLIASFLVLILLIVIYRRLQITKKQKLTIEEQSEELSEANEELNQTNEEIATQRDQIERQKEIVEEAHHEVQSSINYAERIQNALLSTQDHWQNVSPEHFILFKPRDVVSGDFYWAYSDQDLVYWVAADCTGHGVPGAFMSMLGVSFLNEIVAEGRETNAGNILTKLRAKVIKTLEQEGEEQRKDGMDIALCVLNKKTNQLQYAGAYNPLFIIRESTQEAPIGFEKKLLGNTNTLYEYKADRMPIGKFLIDDPFQTTEISLQKGDVLYTFTDGFQDQFGGAQGKKYMIKRMKKLLLEISSQPAHEQHEQLNSEFEEWVQSGDGDQIDDVCVVGVKL